MERMRWVPARRRVNMAGYTDYCTCFYDEETNQVYFWNEITDCKISTQKVKDKEEADTVMKAWVDNAPKGVICQCLD